MLGNLVMSLKDPVEVFGHCVFLLLLMVSSAIQCKALGEKDACGIWK